MERKHLMVLRDIAKYGRSANLADMDDINNAIIAAEKELTSGCCDLDKEIARTSAAINNIVISSYGQAELVGHLAKLLAAKRDKLGIKD